MVCGVLWRAARVSFCSLVTITLDIPTSELCLVWWRLLVRLPGTLVTLLACRVTARSECPHLFITGRLQSNNDTGTEEMDNAGKTFGNIIDN